MISASPASVGARLADVFVLVRGMLETGHLLCVSDSRLHMVAAGLGEVSAGAGGRIRMKRCKWRATGEGAGELPGTGWEKGAEANEREARGNEGTHRERGDHLSF